MKLETVSGFLIGPRSAIVQPVTQENLFDAILQQLLKTNEVTLHEFQHWVDYLSEYKALLDASVIENFIETAIRNKGQYGLFRGEDKRGYFIYNPTGENMSTPAFTGLVSPVRHQAAKALNAALTIMPHFWDLALEQTLEYVRSADLSLRYEGHGLLHKLLVSNERLITSKMAELISDDAAGVSFKDMPRQPETGRVDDLVAMVRSRARETLSAMLRHSRDIFTPRIASQIEAAMNDPDWWERQCTQRALYDPYVNRRPDLFSAPHRKPLPPRGP